MDYVDYLVSMYLKTWDASYHVRHVDMGVKQFNIKICNTNNTDRHRVLPKNHLKVTQTFEKSLNPIKSLSNF